MVACPREDNQIQTHSYSTMEVEPMNQTEFIVLDSLSDQSNASEDSDVICEDRSPEAEKIDAECNCHIEISNLQEKINKLNRKLIRVKDESSSSDGPKPLVQIIFSNGKAAAKYHERVEKFLQHLLQSSRYPENDEQDAEEKSPQAIKVFNGFCLDKDISTRNIEGPIYNFSTQQNILDGTTATASEEDSSQSFGLCFNCCGNHVLKDCPHPLDRNKIAKQKAARQTSVNSNRYHVEEEFASKFQPGVVSERLRHALGLSSREIPPFIYHMRILGYPPGWLREAEIEDSGLKFYETRKDCERRGDDADGCLPVQYDPKRIVDYPGFNQYLQSNTKDDHERLGFPPMQECHLKENMKEMYSFAAPESKNQKRKNSSGKGNKPKRVKTTAEDMDVVIDDTGINEIRSPSPCSQNGENSNSSNDECNVTSPASPKPDSLSLSDLEKVRNSLVNQLNSGGITVESDNGTSSPTVGNKSHSAISVNVEKGSPSIASISGINKLPSFDKFADGIEDHMMFENLEDSVGTFEKMRKVLTSVKRKLNTLQSSA